MEGNFGFISFSDDDIIDVHTLFAMTHPYQFPSATIALLLRKSMAFLGLDVSSAVAVLCSFRTTLTHRA